MSLRIGDVAPDFEANTTKGKIKFHEWLGDSWGILFSHPKDFTPVCTTELGQMAKLEPDFAKRNVKVLGLSVDPVEKHASWAKDIEEPQGAGKLEARRGRHHRRFRLRRGREEDLPQGLEVTEALYPDCPPAARLVSRHSS